jgi:hypothetical protein
MLTLLAIFAGILIAAVVAAVIMRTFWPRRLEPVEMEFDLRAAKLPDDMAEKSLELARTRQLANRRYSLLRSPEKHKPLPLRMFFRGRRWPW